MRINAGHWNDKIRKAIVYLGKLCREYNSTKREPVPSDECLKVAAE
jgi:hypothetical protein